MSDSDLEALSRIIPVSRETGERLERFVALLEKWQTAENLVASGTLKDVWRRHVADSAQLVTLFPEARRWLDLGSGGGFPGMVVAILVGDRVLGSSPAQRGRGTAEGGGGGDPTHRASGRPLHHASHGPPPPFHGGGPQRPAGESVVHLVESNARKCAFLRQAIRETGAPAVVHQGRIQAVLAEWREPIDVVTARALAPLDRLLALVEPILRPPVRGAFPKGRDFEREIAEASKSWDFDLVKHTSRIDDGGVILEVRRLARRDSRS